VLKTVLQTLVPLSLAILLGLLLAARFLPESFASFAAAFAAERASMADAYERLSGAANRPHPRTAPVAQPSPNEKTETEPE
jgi:hypothetical protein